jgi:hypothetical protein
MWPRFLSPARCKQCLVDTVTGRGVKLLPCLPRSHPRSELYNHRVSRVGSEFRSLCFSLHTFACVSALRRDCVDSNSVLSTLADTDAAKASDVYSSSGWCGALHVHLLHVWMAPRRSWVL